MESPSLSKYQISVPKIQRLVQKVSVLKPTSQTAGELANAFFIQEDIRPAVVIDSNNEILHLAGQIDRYLQIRQGTPSFDLFALLDPSMHTEVKATIFSVTKSRKPVRFNRIKFGNKEQLVNIIARPLILDEKDTGLTVINFEDVVEASINRFTGGAQLICADI